MSINYSCCLIYYYCGPYARKFFCPVNSIRGRESARRCVQTDTSQHGFRLEEISILSTVL